VRIAARDRHPSALAMEFEREQMEEWLDVAQHSMSPAGWDVAVMDDRVTVSHRLDCRHGLLVKFVANSVAVKDPPETPSHLLVRPEVRACYQEKVAPVQDHAFELKRLLAPGEGVFMRFQQFRLLKMCRAVLGSLLDPGSFFCTDEPTLAHHKMKRDFPEPGDCTIAGRLQQDGYRAVEGMFISRPLGSGSYKITVVFTLPCEKWTWASWGKPYVRQLAHGAEMAIAWVLNRPGIAELRKLDAEHYVVLAISCIKRGPPMLPSNALEHPAKSTFIQAGEEFGFTHWQRYGSGGSHECGKFLMAHYLQDFLACLGEEIAVFQQLDGHPLVHFQCVVSRKDWTRVRHRFHQVFHLQKAAYRRANGGTNAPSIAEDVQPRFTVHSFAAMPRSTGLPVHKIVIRRTFVEEADDDSPEARHKEEVVEMRRSKSETTLFDVQSMSRATLLGH